MDSPAEALKRTSPRSAPCVRRVLKDGAGRAMQDRASRGEGAPFRAWRARAEPGLEPRIGRAADEAGRPARWIRGLKPQKDKPAPGALTDDAS